MHPIVEFAAYTAIVVVAVVIVVAVLVQSSTIVLRNIRLEIIDPIASKFERVPTIKLSADATKGIIQGAVDGAEIIPNNTIRKTAFEVGRGFVEGGASRREDVSPSLPR